MRSRKNSKIPKEKWKSVLSVCTGVQRGDGKLNEGFRKVKKQEK